MFVLFTIEQFRAAGKHKTRVFVSRGCQTELDTVVLVRVFMDRTKTVEGDSSHAGGPREGVGVEEAELDPGFVPPKPVWV